MLEGTLVIADIVLLEGTLVIAGIVLLAAALFVLLWFGMRELYLSVDEGGR